VVRVAPPLNNPRTSGPAPIMFVRYRETCVPQRLCTSGRMTKIETVANAPVHALAN
jgi:hypothetical protein